MFKTKIAQAKQFIEDNKTPLVFGAGVVTTAAIIAKHPELLFKMADQPVVGLNMDAAQIKREIYANVLAVRYLRDRNLLEDYQGYVNEFAKTLTNPE